MIISFILATAIINFILGFLALSRGKAKINFYFLILSFLLGCWNLSIVFRTIYGYFIFERIIYIFINFIPPFVFLFFNALLKLEKNKFILFNLYSSILFMLTNLIIILLSFLNINFYNLFNLYSFRLYFFIYVFLYLISIFIFILITRNKIKFKQEKTKLTYIIIAFLIIFIGGTLDFTGGLGLHKLWYSGNVANVLYAIILFYAIFKYRLFNADFIFKNFLIYTSVAVILSCVYLLITILFNYNKKLMYANFLLVTLLIVYFSRFLLKLGYLFVEKFGSKSATEKIKEEFEKIKTSNSNETEKINMILALIKKNMEMFVAIYLKQDIFYTKKWCTDSEKFAPYVIEPAEIIEKIILKYDTKDKTKIINNFNCDIIINLSTVNCLLVGVKQTSDISFLEEEINLLLEISETLSFYINTYFLYQKLIEAENNKRTDIMASQISHEIKNPLAALWGAAQLINGKDNQEKENIMIIREEIQRLLKILDDWQAFSKETKLNINSFSLFTLISEVIKIIKKQNDKINMEFIYDKDVIINADEDKIKQVLINILKNALDATEERKEPVISIKLETKQKYAQICVKDNGCGIAQSNLEKLTTPFFTTKQKGSGLGLAISKKIIGAHKGFLFINSDGKSFTEVTITLPIE
jgi:signal transduction histidine kinase